MSCDLFIVLSQIVIKIIALGDRLTPVGCSILLPYFIEINSVVNYNKQ